MPFHQHTLKNGLQIVGERSMSARSVALGFMVRTGSRDETPSEAGLSHFLEHMLFKGTERRSADKVNRDFDRIGADYNAYTSEENTVYYAAVLPEYVPQVVDILSDILRPSLRQEDFDTEKKVIIEEIGMYEDRPHTIAFDYARQAFFDKHTLANSVLGTQESVQALTRDQMMDYFERRYSPSNITVSMAGNFDWDQMVKMIEQHCGGWKSGLNEREGINDTQGSGTFKVMTREEVTQEMAILMSPGPSMSSPLRFAADTLGVVLGDDSGSRLYWALIDPGLADSAAAGYQNHEGTGVLYTYFSSEPNNIPHCLQIVQQVYEEVQKAGIKAEELEQAKNKILSALVRSSERPMGRMMRVGKDWQYLGSYRSIDDDLRAFEQVNLDQIRQVIERFSLTKMTTFALGPMTENDFASTQ